MNVITLPLVPASDFESSNPVISAIDGVALSYFSDNLWDFSPLIENPNCKRSDKLIDFDMALPPRGRLSDIENAKLLISIKGFLYARLTRPHPRTGKTLKARTLAGLWFRLRPLLEWMSVQGIAAFDQVTPAIAAQYAAHVKRSGLAADTQFKRLSVLEFLHLFAEHYPYSLKTAPWPDSSSVAISGSRKSIGPVKQTELIPDGVYQQLGVAALNYVESRSETILSAHDACCDLMRESRPYYVAKHQRGDGYWQGVEYDFVIQNAITSGKEKSLHQIAEAHGFKTFGEIGKSIRSLQVAGYIVCAMFSGLRDSEMSSLELGCHQIKEGLDGEVAHWLYGRTYKLEEDSKEVRWMVPPCVGKAIGVLERLSAYHREGLHHQLEYLLQQPRNNTTSRQIHELRLWSKSLFLTKANRSGYTYRSMDNETVNLRLQKFIDDEGIKDGNNQAWQLRSHQFRRTFAVFVAKNLIGDLRYLRHHFNHWSMDMTLHYARHERGDETLISEIMSERDQITQVIVSNWLVDDKPLLGGRGKAIDSFKKRPSVKTDFSLADAAEALADGLFIRATGHSWCMTNAESCGGEGLYDKLQCTECDNAVIDHRLADTWRGIRDQEEEILLLDDVGDPVKHHARRTIEKADKILEALSLGH